MAQNCPSPADGTFKEAGLHVEDFEHPFEPEHLKGFGQELIQIFTDSMFNTLVCFKPNLYGNCRPMPIVNFQEITPILCD